MTLVGRWKRGGDAPLDLQESLTLVRRWNMGGGYTPGFAGEFDSSWQMEDGGGDAPLDYRRA